MSALHTIPNAQAQIMLFNNRGENRLTSWEDVARTFGHEAINYLRFSVQQLREIAINLQVSEKCAFLTIYQCWDFLMRVRFAKNACIYDASTFFGPILE